MKYRIERTGTDIRNEIYTDDYATAIVVANALARDLRGTSMGVLVVRTETNRVARSFMFKKGARKACSVRGLDGTILVAGE
jgi:hypothetical protein